MEKVKNDPSTRVMLLTLSCGAVGQVIARICAFNRSPGLANSLLQSDAYCSVASISHGASRVGISE